MKRISLGSVVAILAFLAVRFGVEHFRDGGPVPGNIVDVTWTRTIAGNTGISLELPKNLKKTTLPLPDDVKNMIDRSEAFTMKMGGFEVNLFYLKYKSKYTTSLSGAVEGALASVRGMPGTRKVEHAKSPIFVSGLSGYELSVQIQRSKGDPLQMYQILLASNAEAWQVSAIFEAGQPLGDEAWSKIKESLEIRRR